METMQFFTQENILFLLGGLGIFLYGIKLMGESLKELAGDNLRDLINKYTSNKYMGILVGIFVTVFIQSSSGTTALTISLVRAGLMSLTQSIGVIIGSNIGTTVTAFLLGLKIKDYALLFIFVGALVYMFSNRRKNGLRGQIVLGFGMLFYGMALMDAPLSQLADTPQFEQMMSAVAQTPILGIAIGAILTMLVQSSSATIGILQVIYASGAIPFSIAFSILLGDNIGTTVTSFLASIGGSRDSQRAAFSHFSFNLFGTVLFFIIMYVLGGIDFYETFIMTLAPNNLFLQIAFSHFFFNVTIALILMFFISNIEQFVKFIIPISEEEKTIDIHEHILDENLIATAPLMAIDQGKNGLVHMIKIVQRQIEDSILFIETKEKKYYAHVLQLEFAVNTFDKRIRIFMRDLSNQMLDEETMKKAYGYLYSVGDLERIGDLSENIVTKVEMFLDNGEKIEDVVKEELVKMLKVVNKGLKYLIKMYETGDHYIVGMIYENEKHLDKMERKYTKNHLNRVQEQSKYGKTTVFYVDLISDIERMGDHLENMANYFINAGDILSDAEKELNLSEIIDDIEN